MHGMERRAVVAHEAVVGVGIEDHLGRLAGFLQRVAKFVHFGDRNEGVLAAEERQDGGLETIDVFDWRLDARLARLDDAAAVVRRGGSDSGIAACGQETDASAHAEPGGAERGLYFFQAFQMIDRGAHVGDDLIVVDRAHQAKSAGQIVVADDVVGLAKIEIRGDGDETFGCEFIGDAFDLVVEAERFHHDDQRGIGTAGRRTREMRGHILGASANRHFTRDNFHD